MASFQAPVKAVSTFDALAPVIRGLGTIFTAGLGMMIFSTIGALAMPSPPGVGALSGGLLGCLVFAIIGCIATGWWRDMMPSEKAINPLGLLPSALATAVGGHGSFTLIVTVQHAENVQVNGRLWDYPQLFVDIACGDNPVKSTCVKKDRSKVVFNEQFKINVDTLDKVLILQVKDQELFSSSCVGYVWLDIQRDIIDAGFPRNKDYQIHAGEGYILRFNGDANNLATLNLSFDYTADLGAVPKQQREAAEDEMERQQLQADGRQGWDDQNYGAVKFLSQLEFNRDVQLQRGAAIGGR